MILLRIFSLAQERPSQPDAMVLLLPVRRSNSVEPRFPDTIIVSPGIRPHGSPTDDHKRFTTPSEAIRLGADYLVVGRPILKGSTPRKVAEAIMDEIDQAREDKANLRSSSSDKPTQVFMPTTNPHGIAV